MFIILIIGAIGVAERGRSRSDAIPLLGGPLGTALLLHGKHQVFLHVAYVVIEEESVYDC